MRDTQNILEELQLCDDFKTFYDENKTFMVTKPLSEQLCNFAKETGLTKSEIIRRSELSEVYGYQIFSGSRLPERKKLLCLALAMELTLDQVQMLLKTAGYAPLYVKLPADSIIIYGICKKLSVIEVNQMLFQYGCKTLG
jgi:hypothetical protein